MVVVDEGEPEGLGEVGDDALGQHDPQETDPDLAQQKLSNMTSINCAEVCYHTVTCQYISGKHLLQTSLILTKL